MIRRIFLLMVVAFAAIAVNAQSPVSWKMTVNMTSATEGEVVIKATIEPGWHLYSTSLPENGPRPTKFTFETKGVNLKGNFSASPALITKDDPMFGCKLSWWNKNVTFKRSFTITNPEVANITVKVSYMACNDENCMPPKTETLTYTFNK